MVNQLDSVGLKFDDELQALLLLSSLPDNWETLVVSLSNSAPDGKLSMSIVKDALFNEEARRKEMGTDCEDESRALVSDGNRGRSQMRGNRRGGGNHSRPRGGTPIPGSFTCYHCHEEGHIKRNCPKYKGEKGKGKDQSKDAAVVVHESDGELMVAMSDTTDAGKSDWVLDSGCSYHVCGDKRQFWSYEAFDGGFIRMANNSRCRVVGKGIVKFQMPSGKTVRLEGVRHVLGLKKNLISLGMLDERGFSFSASSGVLRVCKGEREMLQGKMIGGLYRLVGSVVTGGAAVRHGTSGIGCSVGQGVHQLPIHTWRERGSTRRCHGSSKSVRDSGLKVREQLIQDVHREAQRKGTGILRMGAPKTKKRVSFVLDLVSDGDLSGVVDTGGGKDPPRTARW